MPAAEQHPSLASLLSASNATAARVFVAHDPQATVLFRAQHERVRAMVDRGIARLTGKATAREAWLSLLSSNDTVGIKVHSAPGAICGTRPAVAAAVVEALLAAGWGTNQIIVWDKELRDLRVAGFTEFTARYGIRVEGAADAGYDQSVYYPNPLLGNLLWGDSEFGRNTNIVGRNSYVSKLVSGGMTKIINVSPLLNDNEVGVAGNLYSLAMGSVDNTRRFLLDEAGIVKALPEIYALQALSDRVVLNIVDALLCQYEGGGSCLLHYSATLNELRFSHDPVALDVLSVQELERQRRLAGAPEVKVRMDLYQIAEVLELGVSDPARIKVERLEPVKSSRATVD